LLNVWTAVGAQPPFEYDIEYQMLDIFLVCFTLDLQIDLHLTFCSKYTITLYPGTNLELIEYQGMNWSRLAHFLGVLS